MLSTTCISQNQALRDSRAIECRKNKKGNKNNKDRSEIQVVSVAHIIPVAADHSIEAFTPFFTGKKRRQAICASVQFVHLIVDRCERPHCQLPSTQTHRRIKLREHWSLAVGT